MVQAAELTQIERDWRARGAPYCDHPRTAPEFFGGSRSGDLGCLVCGGSWPKGHPSQPRGVVSTDLASEMPNNPDAPVASSSTSQSDEDFSIERQVRALASQVEEMEKQKRFTNPADKHTQQSLDAIWQALLLLSRRLDRGD